MFSTTTDKTLICSDCGQEFAFTASEQQFYADRQFSEPRRCPSCRASRKAARGDAGAAAGTRAAPRAAATTAVPARCSARRARAAAARRRSRSDRTAPSRSTAATASRSSAATRPRPIDRPKPGGPRRASSNSRPWRSVMRPRRISRPTLARRQEYASGRLSRDAAGTRRGPSPALATLSRLPPFRSSRRSSGGSPASPPRARNAASPGPRPVAGLPGLQRRPPQNLAKRDDRRLEGFVDTIEMWADQLRCGVRAKPLDRQLRDGYGRLTHGDGILERGGFQREIARPHRDPEVLEPGVLRRAHRTNSADVPAPSSVALRSGSGMPSPAARPIVSICTDSTSRCSSAWRA